MKSKKINVIASPVSGRSNLSVRLLLCLPVGRASSGNDVLSIFPDYRSRIRAIRLRSFSDLKEMRMFPEPVFCFSIFTVVLK